jgi:dipeptidase E
MKLLLISNSTNVGETYLGYSKKNIQSFLEKSKVNEVLFVPYAAVTFSYDAYEDRVAKVFDELGIKVRGLHRESDPYTAVVAARAIVVGGGNTFHLLKHFRQAGIMEVARAKIKNGTPYIGWSAGANLACPTICTTNDMPIVEVESFEALNLIPFQINPHYIDYHPQNHAGETREQRIAEYIVANPDKYVAGLREGCILHYENEKLNLTGPKSVRVFRQGHPAKEISPGEDLGFLIKH